ncbi:MAG: class I SAM-dependent methyltransferase [Desulfopila sp.]
MKKWLIEKLICPECLNQEIPLTVNSQKENDEEIMAGQLICPECGRRHPIVDGVAVIVPEKTLPLTSEATGYGSYGMLSSYLWSHFSEFFNGPEATDAYRKWADTFVARDGWALDIGCSVGRLTFEMSRKHGRAVGIDTSRSFIAAARELAARQTLEFEMIIEGRITETRSCTLDRGFSFADTEFIVADAMALPFRTSSFVTVSSVNILEKVPDPAGHLSEANRIMTPQHNQLLFSDPFSWDESVSAVELWLGGTNEGPYKGFGIDNIRRILQDPAGIFAPGFKVRDTGEVLWKIRKTRNLWEHITSQFVIAQREL